MPLRGAEYLVAWNYVGEISLNSDFIVLYGLAGDDMDDIDEVERSGLCQKVPNVSFVAVRPDSVMSLLNAFNRGEILVYTFYFAYKLWHRKAYKVAKESTAEQPSILSTIFVRLALEGLATYRK